MTLSLVFAIFLSVLFCTKGEEPPAYPTNVYVTIHSNKIGGIKEREGQFGFDIYFFFTWRDDRKAEMANFSDTYDHESHWYPNPEIMNSAVDYDPQIGCYFGANGEQGYLQGPTADELGGTWIYCTSRMRLTLDADLILKAFPWDKQKAFLTIESGGYSVESLNWLPTGITSLMPEGNPNSVAGWKIISTGSDTGVHFYPTFAASYSTLTFWLILERVPDYFIVSRVTCPELWPQQQQQSSNAVLLSPFSHTHPLNTNFHSPPSSTPPRPLTEPLYMGGGVPCVYGPAGAVCTWSRAGPPGLCSELLPGHCVLAIYSGELNAGYWLQHKAGQFHADSHGDSVFRV